MEILVVEHLGVREYKCATNGIPAVLNDMPWTTMLFADATAMLPVTGQSDKQVAAFFWREGRVHEEGKRGKRRKERQNWEIISI